MFSIFMNDPFSAGLGYRGWGQAIIFATGVANISNEHACIYIYYSTGPI